MSPSQRDTQANDEVFDIDKLLLSANLFSSSIESWIPDSFGPKRSDSERLAEVERALQRATRNADDSRLGLGHPDIGKARKAPGLDSLHRQLGKLDKGKGRAKVDENVAVAVSARKVAIGVGDDDDEEEEESRATMIGKKGGKRKPGALDLMAGKKKRTATGSVPGIGSGSIGASTSTSTSASSPTGEMPSRATSIPLNLSARMDSSTNPKIDHEASNDTGNDTNDRKDSDDPHTPVYADDDSFPFSGPIALDSPQAKRFIEGGKLGGPSTDGNDTPVPKSSTLTSIAESWIQVPTPPPSTEIQTEEQPSGRGGAEIGDELGEGSARHKALSLLGRMTKAERRNEKRKRAKLIKQQIHGHG